MMKYIIWGLGKQYTKYAKYIKGEIVAYVDNNCVGKIMPDGKTVIDIFSVAGVEYDRIIICSTKYSAQMMEQLIDLKICPREKIQLIDDMIGQDVFFEFYQQEISNHCCITEKREKLLGIKCVYVLAPIGCKTGGPELLHQLVYILIKNSVCAKIVYPSDNLSETIVPEFQKYVSENVVRIEDVEDSEENVIVLPEVWSKYITKFRHARKYFWWMSVDNFITSIQTGDVENVLKYADLHLYQSEYARLFLKKLHIGDEQMCSLSDYINDDYVLYSEEEIRKNNREDIIVYNPKKGIVYTDRIISSMGGYHFVPISNMNNDEVRCLLSKSKVYIDFGKHPGKDRIPREAAIMGCCVITGRRGSADNDIDIRIDGSYKFDQDTVTIEDIVEKIKYCLENYESCIQDFEEYRTMIRAEKGEFERCAREVFVRE